MLFQSGQLPIFSVPSVVFTCSLMVIGAAQAWARRGGALAPQ